MKQRAFTLVEVLGVLLIVGVLAALSAPGFARRFVSDQMKAEDTALAAIQQDIVRSFDSEDFAAVNLAALAGEVPAGVAPTAFAGSVSPTYTSTAASDWFAKVAALRGIGITSAAPTAANQPAVASLLFNAYHRSRLLVAGPVESTQQRFLLVSLMARPEQLVMPENDGSAAWFNSIWNTNWDTTVAGLPSFWATHLSTAQAAAWNGDAHGSNLYRLRVVKIVLPRFTVALSNSHPTANGYVYYNGSGSPLVTSAANSGVTMSPGILGGRVVRIFKGAAPSSATQTSQLTLRENTDVLIQNSN